MAFRTVDLSEDSDALAYVQSLGYRSAPVVAVDEVTHWSGFEPGRVAGLADHTKCS